AAAGLAVTAAGCAAPGRAPRAADPSPGEGGPAGTYRVQVCGARCAPGDTAAAGFLGVLVLDTADLPVSHLSGAERRAFPFASFADEADAPSNLCFVLREGPAISHSMAGIHEVGRARWRRPAPGPARDSGVVEFELYGSADAGYSVRAVAGGGRLEGMGSSWGAGVVEHSIQEHIVGVRTGPPQPELCWDAVRTAVREAPERERVLRWRHALAHPAARVFAAAADALRDLGFDVADSSAAAGRLRSAPREAVTAPGAAAVPPRTWAFPDSVAIELTVRRTGRGDSAQVALVVLSPLRPGARLSDDVSLQRLWLAATLWARIEERLAPAPAPAPRRPQDEPPERGLTWR
ncbi:MAG TPA: hypothetical protein VKA84_07815, partial [Gemmatimonadaceae bacterium]|nr:hypothetical protein [Gemmatimonadaceae bacterium]